MQHSSNPQLRIAATYMRGGTSKGVFFKLEDLPTEAQVPGAARDALLTRVIGSPDPYAKHTDGMGGATSSTSKCVIIAKSSVPDHDVDYLYGQVAIEQAFVDWSGNCGNLSSAVGPVRDRKWPGRSGASAARWPRDGAHLAGQHRQDHSRPCADAGRAGAGARRFRTRWRDLSGGRDRARIPRPRRRFGRRQRFDVPDREPRRAGSRCLASAASTRR